MPYTSYNKQRQQQSGIGRSIWGGAPPPPIPERVLDGIPGFIAWVTLLFSIASAVAFPRTLMLFAAMVALYSAIRFLLAGIANGMGIRKIARWEKIDWYQKYLEDADDSSLPWDKVQHVVIIPNYSEPLEILRRTLDQLKIQYEAKTRLTIILAMEAGEQDSNKKAEQLQKEYQNDFANIFYTLHPRGIPGEMQCKSANQSWAARWYINHIINRKNQNIDHVLITTMDADTRWHPRHFFALTYYFAIDKERYHHFWQAPIRYHGNIWNVNPLMRIVNSYATAFELAYLSAPWWMAMPMSSYSLSLKLLANSGNWDGDVIADEWHMMIKAYFASDGKVSLKHIFLPFLADSTTGDNIVESVKNRYTQTLRHAWGSKEVGYMIAKLIENPHIASVESFKLLFRIAHDILLAGAGWIILTVGSQLPVLFHPEIAPIQLDALIASSNKIQYVVDKLLADNPAWILLGLSSAIMILMVIVFQYQDHKVRPERIAPYTASEVILELLSIPFMLILTLFVVALPTLVAQTRLLLGIPLQFIVTDKS